MGREKESERERERETEKMRNSEGGREGQTEYRQKLRLLKVNTCD